MKIINKSANPLPKYETEKSAGMDLMSNEGPFIIKPFERVLIGTGLYIKIPDGFEGQIRARSGLSYKKGLTLANAVGTIDGDYTGELKVSMVNISDSNQTIMKGDRIAQLVISPVMQVILEEVDKLDETERGNGGFGSTGK